MSDRDELAALVVPLLPPTDNEGWHIELLPYARDIADAIFAAFDVTPKPVDTEPPPAETFNAITDWREPVPGWETLTYKTPGSAVVTREYTVPKGQ